VQAQSGSSFSLLNYKESILSKPPFLGGRTRGSLPGVRKTNAPREIKPTDVPGRVPSLVRDLNNSFGFYGAIPTDNTPESRHQILRSSPSTEFQVQLTAFRGDIDAGQRHDAAVATSELDNPIGLSPAL
jgi:hypothetical protein